MGLFDRFRKPAPACLDPVFGELKYVHGAWSGALQDGPLGNDVEVDIQGPEEPSENHRPAFAELLTRWSSLQPDIAEALFSLWSPHLAEWGGEEPPLVTSQDSILRYTTLDSVEIGPGPSIILRYGFVEEVGWDDAMFSVEVSGGRVSARSLDD